MKRSPTPDATIEDSIVLMLFDVANGLGKLGNGVSAGAGLTTQQWLLLLQIAGDPNFATPPDVSPRNGAGVMASEIARARGVSRANVSTLVAQLLRTGLVQQQEQPDDRRRKHLAVTDAGRRALAAIATARRDANARLLAGLTLAERREFQRLLHRCLERLWQADRPRGLARAPARAAGRTKPAARHARGGRHEAELAALGDPAGDARGGAGVPRVRRTARRT